MGKNALANNDSLEHSYKENDQSKRFDRLSLGSTKEEAKDLDERRDHRCDK